MTAGNQPSRVKSFVKSGNTQDWMPMPVIEFGRHVVGCPLRRRYRSTAVRSVLGKEPGVGLKELVPLPLSLGSIHPTQSPAMLNAGGPIHGAVGSGPGTLSWLR